MDAIVIAGYECEALLFSLLQAGRLCAPRARIGAAFGFTLVHGVGKTQIQPDPRGTPRGREALAKRDACDSRHLGRQPPSIKASESANG